MTSVPEITRMIARIEDWKERLGKARGRAVTDRVLGEAHKLFHEISNMLTEMRAGVARGRLHAALCATSDCSATRRIVVSERRLVRYALSLCSSHTCP